MMADCDQDGAPLVAPQDEATEDPPAANTRIRVPYGQPCPALKTAALRKKYAEQQLKDVLQPRLLTLQYKSNISFAVYIVTEDKQVISCTSDSLDGLDKRIHAADTLASCINLHHLEKGLQLQRSRDARSWKDLPKIPGLEHNIVRRIMTAGTHVGCRA